MAEDGALLPVAKHCVAALPSARRLPATRYLRVASDSLRHGNIVRHAQLIVERSSRSESADARPDQSRCCCPVPLSLSRSWRNLKAVTLLPPSPQTTTSDATAWGPQRSLFQPPPPRRPASPVTTLCSVPPRQPWPRSCLLRPPNFATTVTDSTTAVRLETALLAGSGQGHD